MAGQEDWEQFNINGVGFWGHKPCGQLIMMSATSLHEGLCPAQEKTS